MATVDVVNGLRHDQLNSLDAKFSLICSWFLMSCQ